MAENQNTKDTPDPIDLTTILAKTKANYEEIEDGQTKLNAAWMGTNKMVETYNKKLQANELLHEDTTDLVKENLRDTQALIKATKMKSELSEKDKDTLIESLQTEEATYKKTLEQLKVQNVLKAKADGMLDGLESQIKKVPIVGDILASTLDFGGLKKEMGVILGGVAKNFTELTDDGMAVGPALAKSFGGAIKGIGPLLKNLGVKIYGLMGPILLVVGAMYILKKAFAFSQDVADLSRELGVGNDAAREMSHNFQEIAASSSNLSVNVKALVGAQKELSAAFGSNVQMSEEMLKNQIALTKFYGMSGDEAAKFQKTSAILGTNAKDLKLEVASTVGGMNDMYNVGLGTGDVMKEIGKLSAQNLATFKGNTKELVATVSMAKALGTSIDKINESADKTLSIESSLKAEAKARMMTGISINNNAVRNARLNGSTADVLKAQMAELAKIEDLNGMLPKQQDALADAMGMSTEEMLEMKNQQTLLNELGAKNLDQLTLENVKKKGLTSEAAKEFVAQQEKLAAQEKMAGLMTKLEDTAMKLAAPLMDLLDPMMQMVDFILPAIGPLLKFAFAPIMLVVNIVKGLAKIFKGDMAGGIHEIGAGILEFMYKPFFLVVDLVSGFFPSIGQAIENAFGNLKSLAADILPDWATKLLFGTDDKGNVSGTEYDSEGNVVDSINDGVITPEGDVVKTNPADYIMAMMNPMDMMSNIPNPMDMMSNIPNPMDFMPNIPNPLDFMSNIPNPLDVVGDALDGIGNLVGGESSSTGIDYDKLAAAISAQPIMITVDGKVVSEITRVQNKQSSFRK